jgi:hypothetical protein
VDGVFGVTVHEDSTAVEVRCDDGPSKFRALSAVVESGAGLVDFETAAVPLNEAFQRITEASAQGGSRD